MERNPELEAVLVREPQDALGYLAFAEWRKEQGDPWGELIEAMVEADEAGQDQNESERVARLREQVLADLRRREPALGDQDLDADDLELRWGFADIFASSTPNQEALQAVRDPFFLVTTSLDFSTAPISDLSPVAGLARLEELDIYETQISDLRPLSKLVYLTLLDLQQTRVTDLGPLAGLTRLESLNLSATRVRDLEPLLGLKNLTNLYLSDTDVDPVQLENLARALPDLDIER